MKRFIAVAALLVSLALAAYPQQQEQPATRTVRVVGEVKMPGVYNLRSDQTTVTQAIAMAQGLTAGADAKAVAITRKDGEKITIDLRAVLTGRVPDMFLRDGDVVRVPGLSK